MATPDLGVFQRNKTKIDYDRAAQEFQMRKEAAEMKKRMDESSIAINEQKLANPQLSSELPSSIREWQAFQSMPETDQSRYLEMKRANPYLNRGDEFTKIDPVSNQPIHSMPINPKMAETPEYRARQERAVTGAREQTQAQLKAQLMMPQIEEDAAYMTDLLADIERHPGLKSGTGLSRMIPAIPGTKRKAFDVLLDQVKGKQFMEAYKTLKGGGQITEIEGQKATQALARMDAAQSEEDFIEAVQDFEAVVRRGLLRARQEAWGGQQAPASLYEQSEQQFNNQQNDPLGIR